MSWIEETLLTQTNNISKKDLDLIHVVDTKEEVLEILEGFHKSFGLSPNF